MVNEIDSSSLRTQMAAEERPLIIDIRTAVEVAQAAIPGALHIPMHLLPLRMNELPQDKNIVLYCRSGARSYRACLYLLQQGLNNVINLRGGILSWIRQGFEIVPGMGR